MLVNLVFEDLFYFFLASQQHEQFFFSDLALQRELCASAPNITQVFSVSRSELFCFKDSSALNEQTHLAQTADLNFNLIGSWQAATLLASSG